MACSIEQLRKTSDEELIRQHDSAARHTAIGVDYLLSELRRREADEQHKIMINVTWAIAAMTLIVTGATTINLNVRL